MNAPSTPPSFNIFAEIEKETKRYVKQIPCRCGAYKFPHRKDGGRCNQSEIEECELVAFRDPRPWWEIDADNAGQSATGSI